MTAICAVVEHLDGGDKVWMGGDSAGTTSGFQLVQRADPKVFVNGPFLMGFTSSFRMGDLLHWSFDPPNQPEGVTDERFMATTFVDAVRKCLSAGGFAKKENEVETGGYFLVGYHGRVWVVGGDYQMGRPTSDFYAIGAGDDLCLGALHATPLVDPEPRLRLALQAAERFNAAVREPFVVLREP